MKKIRFLTLSFWIFISALFLYSYTQVDLSLTLSRASIYQTIEKFFQYVGYFNRPLSTVIYLILLFLFFIFYFLFLRLAKNITLKTLWITIFVLTVILTFSYNGFSYDLFNYIFDAKIFTHYHLNPYFYMALNFPHDPMLSFMHWTQRTYPYGPFWLLLTVPLSFLGLNFFLPTFFLFKILASISFLGSCFLIYKIAKKLNKDEKAILTAFAFNPLVIIEVLVSAHNDIEMMFFSLLAIYFFIDNKYIKSILSLFFSVGIKFATVFISPILIIYFLKKRKIDDKFFIWSVFFMLIGVIIASLRTTFQPWYLLYVLPFSVFLINKKYIFISIFILSITALLNYVPFLYTGNWNPPIPRLLLILNLSGLGLSILISALLILVYKGK